MDALHWRIARAFSKTIDIFFIKELNNLLNKRYGVISVKPPHVILFLTIRIIKF